MCKHGEILFNMQLCVYPLDRPFLTRPFVFTCGRRPTGHGVIPVVVVGVVVERGGHFSHMS